MNRSFGSKEKSHNYIFDIRVIRLGISSRQARMPGTARWIRSRHRCSATNRRRADTSNGCAGPRARSARAAARSITPTRSSPPASIGARTRNAKPNFTVTANTVMERSHIALHKWLRAFHLMCSSRNGISARQLQQTLGITYRSAWFMVQRIRKAMIAGGVERSGNSRAAEQACGQTIKRPARAGRRLRRKNA